MPAFLNPPCIHQQLNDHSKPPKLAHCTLHTQITMAPVNPLNQQLQPQRQDCMQPSVNKGADIFSAFYTNAYFALLKLHQPQAVLCDVDTVLQYKYTEYFAIAGFCSQCTIVHLTLIPEKICICVLAFCILQFA